MTVDSVSGNAEMPRLEIRWSGPGERPSADVVALRRAIYTEESGLLAEKDLVDEDDLKARHLCIYAETPSGKRLVAAMQVLDAEAGSFGRHTGLSREVLENGYCGSRAVVDKEFRRQGLFSLLLYIAMRDYRMKGRKYMFGFMEPGETPGYKILRFQLIDGVQSRSIQGKNGKSYQVVAAWQDLAYGLHRAFESMPEPLKAFVQTSGILADEIETTVRARIQEFYTNPWFELVRNGELTKEHYTAVLSNMHQFVRWTTRILGKVVGFTAESPLRRHYISHLEGEVDHDVLIEQDLRYLDVDVEYVKNYMAPAVEIQEFMATQESLCGFRQDPLLFLAVPFSVEGLSAHVPKEIMQSLFKCIEGWGVKNPRKAMSFLGSHVNTDGGPDGHWEMSREMIKRYITTEAQLQRFLNVVHMVMNSHFRAYSAYASIPTFSKTVKTSSQKQRTNVAA